MAWSNSKVFGVLLEDLLKNTAAFALASDTLKVALYNNSITPDQTVSAANSAYNSGQWATAQEVYESGQWAQGGVSLASVTVTRSSATTTLDAADTASGSAADLANVHGCLIYDDTLTTPVADQGICYVYFGGGSSVVNGTLTVQWSASGIATFAA